MCYVKRPARISLCVWLLILCCAFISACFLEHAHTHTPTVALVAAELLCVLLFSAPLVSQPAVVELARQPTGAAEADQIAAQQQAAIPAPAPAASSPFAHARVLHILKSLLSPGLFLELPHNPVVRGRMRGSCRERGLSNWRGASRSLEYCLMNVVFLISRRSWSTSAVVITIHL